MPPGIDDDGFLFAHRLVIPAPHLGLDRLPHRGHVLEVVVVLLRFIRSEFAQHSNGRGRGVEDVDAEALGDAPWAAAVRISRDTFVQHAARPK